MKIPDNIKRMVRERGKLRPRMVGYGLRSIAGLARKAKESTRELDFDRSKELRQEAEKLALENLRQRTILHHLDDPKSGAMKDELKRLINHCQSLLDALDGEVKVPKPDQISRFLDAVNDHCKKYGESPTHKDLKAAGLRGELISDVSSYLKKLNGTDLLGKDKRGPKSI